MGGHVGGEAGTWPSGAFGSRRGDPLDGVARDGVGGREGDDDGDGGDGDVQDRGERSKSSSPSASRNSSSSLRRLRTLLGGGLKTSGEGGVGGVGELPPAVAVVAEAAVFVGVPSVQAPTVVAARLRRRRRRRRRRRLAPVVAAADDAGILHVRVTI